MRSQVIFRKPKSRWLPWRPSCFRCGAEFLQKPSFNQVHSPYKIWCWSARAFSSYCPETKIKMAVMAAILFLVRGWILKERNLPFIKSNLLTKYNVDQWMRSQVIFRKPKSRWLPWRPSCFRCGAEFLQKPSFNQVHSPYKIWCWSARAFSSYCPETKIKMAVMAAILF